MSHQGHSPYQHYVPPGQPQYAQHYNQQNADHAAYQPHQEQTQYYQQHAPYSPGYPQATGGSYASVSSLGTGNSHAPVNYQVSGFGGQRPDYGQETASSSYHGTGMNDARRREAERNNERAVFEMSGESAQPSPSVETQSTAQRRSSAAREPDDVAAEQTPVQANPWPFYLEPSPSHPTQDAQVKTEEDTQKKAEAETEPVQAFPWPYHGPSTEEDAPRATVHPPLQQKVTSVPAVSATETEADGKNKPLPPVGNDESVLDDILSDMDAQDAQEEDEEEQQEAQQRPAKEPSLRPPPLNISRPSDGSARGEPNDVVTNGPDIAPGSAAAAAAAAAATTSSTRDRASSCLHAANPVVAVSPTAVPAVASGSTPRGVTLAHLRLSSFGPNRFLPLQAAITTCYSPFSWITRTWTRTGSWITDYGKQRLPWLYGISAVADSLWTDIADPSCVAGLPSTQTVFLTKAIGITTARTIAALTKCVLGWPSEPSYGGSCPAISIVTTQAHSVTWWKQTCIASCWGYAEQTVFKERLSISAFWRVVHGGRRPCTSIRWTARPTVPDTTKHWRQHSAKSVLLTTAESPPAATSSGDPVACGTVTTIRPAAELCRANGIEPAVSYIASIPGYFISSAASTATCSFSLIDFTYDLSLTYFSATSVHGCRSATTTWFSRCFLSRYPQLLTSAAACVTTGFELSVSTDSLPPLPPRPSTSHNGRPPPPPPRPQQGFGSGPNNAMTFPPPPKPNYNNPSSVPPPMPPRPSHYPSSYVDLREEREVVATAMDRGCRLEGMGDILNNRNMPRRKGSTIPNHTLHNTNIKGLPNHSRRLGLIQTMAGDENVDERTNSAVSCDLK
ncbi:hypothetical protein LIA77_08498 [Sarocladium implicatum]|nr:hypothetical protein LIA77_08498 [Sarocladium implicatum]